MDIQERQPLLNPSITPNSISHSSQQEPLSRSSDEFRAPYTDILPGTPYRKSINWSSAYILVVSRVIGSGIFATPGSIVKSAGSIGLTLVEPTELQHKLLAVGLLTAITIVHACFLKTGIFVQNVLGWVKIFLIGAISLTGIWVVFLQFHGDTDNIFPESTAGSSFWDSMWEGSNWSWSPLSSALFKVYYSYAGLSNVNNVLNEVHDPVGIVKTVCPTALVTAGALYFLANLSYFLVIPLEEIKNNGELVGALLFERLFGDHVGKIFFPLAIAISAAGNVMVVTFALARVNQEIARQGFLPWQSVLSSSRPFGTPLGGLIVHYIPSALVLALPPQGDVYNFILDLEGYPGQMFSLAITLGLLIVRYREPHLPRPFRAWLPAVWLRVVVCLVLLVTPFIPPPNWKGDVDFFYATYALVGIGIVLFGVLYWYVWTVLIPRWGGYQLEEDKEIMADGTSIIKLVHTYHNLQR
ncbi:Amino acid/polyamine transporter I [Penicillium griseofulvum]|uniref:Amino acid/polyamine transporter I n=1 Tax=Penicillium patulum TaxID=5078 RepID=A0A135LGG3_PENPA|nr:Amino acid/polyamine transporter I [Penicillium griseofulvum]KXG48033.1 Amino acid/polyamine transporter I [Penicillium griseofulvum]